MTTAVLNRPPLCARIDYSPPPDLPALPVYSADLRPLAGAQWAAAETVETLHPVLKPEPSDWLCGRRGRIWLLDPYNAKHRRVSVGDVIELLWMVRLGTCCKVEFLEDGTIVAPVGAALGNTFWLDHGVPVYSLEAYRREFGPGVDWFFIDAWSEKIPFRVVMNKGKPKLELA